MENNLDELILGKNDFWNLPSSVRTLKKSLWMCMFLKADTGPKLRDSS